MLWSEDWASLSYDPSCRNGCPTFLGWRPLRAYWGTLCSLRHLLLFTALGFTLENKSIKLGFTVVSSIESDRTIQGGDPDGRGNLECTNLIVSPGSCVSYLDMFLEIVWQKQTFWGFIMHIYIFFFIPLKIFVPCVDIFLLVNRYFLVCIFKYRTSLRQFHWYLILF